MKKTRSTHLSTSRAIRPYDTLLTPAHPYPLIVAPKRPSSPISLRMVLSKSTVQIQPNVSYWR